MSICNQKYGHQSYELYTIDQLFNRFIKSMLSCSTKELNVKLIATYVYYQQINQYQLNKQMMISNYYYQIIPLLLADQKEIISLYTN